MMEIVYGPVILTCALKSAMFAVGFALLYPLVEARLMGPVRGGLARRAGLALLGGGLFGLAHLVIVCAADGFPPRIIQSTALGLAILALAGVTLLALVRPARSRA